MNDESELVDLPKLRLQVTVREDLVKWIDEQVKSLRFANRSHAIEYALVQLKGNGEAQNTKKQKKT